jgi:hypothetical protein
MERWRDAEKGRWGDCHLSLCLFVSLSRCRCRCHQFIDLAVNGLEGDVELGIVGVRAPGVGGFELLTALDGTIGVLLQGEQFFVVVRLFVQLGVLDGSFHLA